MATRTGIGQAQLGQCDYDRESRRIRKQVSDWVAGDSQLTTDRRFIYDGWNLIAVLGPQSSVLQSFVWGLDLSGTLQGAGGVGGLLQVTHYGTQTTNCFLAYDGNGNVVALVDAQTGALQAQYEYGPFAEPIRATGPLAAANPFRSSTKYQDDDAYSAYVQSNQDVTAKARAQLLAEAQHLCRQGQLGAFRVYLRFHSECSIPEGYGYVTGYHLLFGSNADEGGYQIVGTATVEAAGAGCCVVKFDVTHAFHDRIDPNPQDLTDVVLSRLAEFLLAGSPDDYPIHIYWKESCEYRVAGTNESLTGWPLAGTSAPPVSPPPGGRR